MQTKYKQHCETTDCAQYYLLSFVCQGSLRHYNSQDSSIYNEYILQVLPNFVHTIKLGQAEEHRTRV